MVRRAISPRWQTAAQECQDSYLRREVGIARKGGLIETHIEFRLFVFGFWNAGYEIGEGFLVLRSYLSLTNTVRSVSFLSFLRAGDTLSDGYRHASVVALTIVSLDPLTSIYIDSATGAPHEF